MQIKLLLLTITYLAFLSGKPVINHSLSTTEKAPAFTVETLEGEEITLNDLNGKVIYVSFWASWCGPCIAGFRKHEQLRRQLEEIGVVLLNVSIDKTESEWVSGLASIPPVGIQAFVKKDKAQLMHDYQLGSIPAYYIIDKKGNFAYLSTKPDRNILQEFKDMVNK